MGAGDGQAAQEVRGFERRAPEAVAVGFEQCGQPVEVGRLVTFGGRLEGRRQLHHLDGGAQLQDVREPAAEDLHRGDESGFERQGRVDRGQRGVDRLGVEGGFDHRRDEALLVGEDPEDRALGDPGRFGDLAGRDGRAVHQQQRQRRGDDLGSAFGGRQRRRPFGGDHGPSI